MALPKDMRLKGHRTFDYIHKNSVKYYGKLMTFKIARSNQQILRSHRLSNYSNNFKVAIAISKKVSKLLERFRYRLSKTHLSARTLKSITAVPVISL